MSEFGLYIDNKTNPPMVYDEFTRQFMASILAEGYNGTFLILFPQIMFGSMDFSFHAIALWRGTDRR